MFENDFIQANTTLTVAVCILYAFGSIAVGIISKQLKLHFGLGFVWSIVFTPIVGLILVLRNNPAKKK
jgi:hypothetical protein